MPRDLGRAGVQDLTGHLPGSSDELVSPIMRFLQDAGQIQPPRQGSFRDNGNGQHEGESPLPSSSAAQSLRAEVSGAFLQTEMESFDEEPLLDLEPALPPVSADHRVAEFFEDGPDLFDDDETDTAPPRHRRGIPTVKPDLPELPPADTGFLELESSSSLHDTFAAESEIESIGADAYEPEYRDTAKLESPFGYSHQTDKPVLRDTVNYFNKTQSLDHEQLEVERPNFPTIPRNVVSGDEPIDLRSRPVKPVAKPVPETEAANHADSDTKKFRISDLVASKPRSDGDARSKLPVVQGDWDLSIVDGKTAALPRPDQFWQHGSPSQRAIPELNDPLPESDDTPTLEETGPAPGRITEKVAELRAGLPHTDRVPQPYDPVPEMTDALARRIRKEREETLQLIRQAEEVAARLREASSRSRADLEAISDRRPATASDTHLDEPVPVSMPAAVLDQSGLAEVGVEAEPGGIPVVPRTTTSDVFAQLDAFLSTLRLPAVPEAAPSAQSTIQHPAASAVAVEDLIHQFKQTSEPVDYNDAFHSAARRVPSPPAASTADERAEADDLLSAVALLRRSLVDDLEQEPELDEPAFLPESARFPEPFVLSRRLIALRRRVDSRRDTGNLPRTGLMAPLGEAMIAGWRLETLWRTRVAFAGGIVALAAVFCYILYRSLSS